MTPTLHRYAGKFSLWISALWAKRDREAVERAERIRLNRSNGAKAGWETRRARMQFEGITDDDAELDTVPSA